jgi:LytS/YehU family sensor histidine kinase
VATVLGLSSAIQADRLTALAGHDGGCGSCLLVMNVWYWYVPALLVPVMFRLAVRWPLDTKRPAKAIAKHVAASIVYSFVHTLAMTVVRLILLPDMTTRLVVQRDYLTQLDFLLVTYWGTIGVAHALTYRRDSELQRVAQAQLETRLLQARLDALRHQLRPHFLFNTLHTISGLIHTDTRAADVTIDHLGTLLRRTLASNQQEQPLEEELIALQPYIAIEHIRFRDRLRVRLDVDPDAGDVLVPALVLQPLVENAIRHGIAPLARGGEVVVRARIAGEVLTLQVIDDGAGLPPMFVSSHQHGVGLANTRARLEYLYGAHQSLTLAGGDSGGCTVTITLPARSGRALRVDADAVAV